MPQPLVSVVVPNYNYAAFLPERLDSILAQTYRNIEVILLDDCSTDDSMAVMQHYQTLDTRIRPIVCNTTNSGSPYQQWTKGIQMAQGQYIWIAEADDTADPTLLEKAINQLEQHPLAMLVQVDSWLINDDGKILTKDIDHWKRNHIIPDSVCLLQGKTFIQRQMYWKNRIYNASGVVVRRAAITTHVLETLSIPHISDWVFWSAIIRHGELILIHERLNRFRQHTTSLTHSVTAHQQGAHNEALVVNMLQHMVSIPAFWRLRRMRKILSRYHVIGHGGWKDIIFIWQAVVANHTIEP